MPGTDLTALATKPELDAAIKAINPTGAIDINDPALAGFKKSILDEVAMKLAGDSRKAPPEDIMWTGPASGEKFFARMIGGIIQLKGVVPLTLSASSRTLGTLPATFPTPELDASYPVACRETGVQVRYGYVSVARGSRAISFSPGGGNVNEVTVSGVQWKAEY